MLEIKDNALTAEIYNNLHRDADFIIYEDSDVEKALAADIYDVVIFKDNDAIACGRVIGDTRIVFFIKDVIVRSDFRKQGYGKMIVEKLLEYIRSKACPQAYVGLMSTPGKEKFYEKFGFIRRPNADHGSGMVMFIEK